MPQQNATPEDTTAEPLPLMERVGVDLLRRASLRQRERLFGDDEIHTLNEDEQRELLRIERRTVYRAAVVGAVTGFVGAVAEIAVGPELDLFDSALSGWIFLGVGVGIASLLELSYLYILALQAVDDLAFAAGIDLRQESESGQHLIRALARAALEVPNPVTPVFGVDPRREASRLWLLAATLIYKAKVGITNFVLKAAVRRLLARAGLRFAAAYVAIPVLAIWDAVVLFMVLREARLRVIGPSAVVAFVTLIVDHRGPSPSVPARQALLGAVASCIMVQSDMHPNLQTMLEVLYQRYDDVNEDSIADRTDRFLADLRALGPDDQRMVLELLTATSILTGRLRRKGRTLLLRAYTACDRPLDLDAVKTLTTHFVRGKAVTRDLLDQLTPDTNTPSDRPALTSPAGKGKLSPM